MTNSGTSAKKQREKTISPVGISSERILMMAIIIANRKVERSFNPIPAKEDM
jgi:hypothetical protein